MPKFLAVHPLPNPMTVEEATPLGKKARSLCTPDAYWVSSWAQLDSEGKISKFFCEWNGKDPETIRDIIKKAEIPLEDVYPMMKIDSENFI